MNIINSSTIMKSAPSEMSSLETECLFGEKVEIIDKHLDWVYCKLELTIIVAGSKRLR